MGRKENTPVKAAMFGILDGFCGKIGSFEEEQSSAELLGLWNCFGAVFYSRLSKKINALG